MWLALSIFQFPKKDIACYIIRLIPQKIILKCWQPNESFYQTFTNFSEKETILYFSEIKTAHEKSQMCSLIGVEGGHSLAGSLAVLRTLYHIGVRYLTLTSTCNTPWYVSVFIEIMEEI